MSQIQRYRIERFCMQCRSNAFTEARITPDRTGSLVRYADHEAQVEALQRELQNVGERAAREVVGCFDVAPHRGKSYANSVTQTIAIIIQQQIKAALASRATQPAPQEGK